MTNKQIARDAALAVAAKEILISDPSLFIAYYSGLKLAEFQVDILDFLKSTQRAVCLLPATHGKSTLISKWYIIWRIAHNPNVRIILVLKNQDEADLFATSIRNELTQNQQLVEDWGPFKPEGRDAMWNNSSIFVAQRQINDVRPTVEFAGSKSMDQVLGHRCDILVCDDIVTLETVNTREQSAKQIKKFNLGAQTCPRYLWDINDDCIPEIPPGIHFPLDAAYRQVILAGTCFKPYDLFHDKAGRISKIKPGVITKGKDPTYKVLYYDCWKDRENLVPLWPQQWTPQGLLDEEKSMGHIEFNARYRNIAVDEGQAVFKRRWIYGDPEDDITYPGCLDRLRRIGDTDHLEDPYFVLGFDPSTSRVTKGSSFCAFVLLAVDKKEDPMRRYLIDCYKAQMGFEDIFSHLFFGDSDRNIVGLWDKYHYDELRVEVNSWSKWLMDADKTKSAISHGVRVVPHETQRNKVDPEMGVGSLQQLFQNALFRIPYHHEAGTREPIEEFLQQVEEFPEGEQDFPMAMWFAELGIRSMDSGYKAWSAGNSKGFYHDNPFYARASR